MDFSQIPIAFTGVVAIILTQSTNSNHRKLGPIFGLLGQPFWMYTSFLHQQWGVFGLTWLYLLVWLLGFYNHWIKKPTRSTNQTEVYQVRYCVGLIPEQYQVVECDSLEKAKLIRTTLLQDYYYVYIIKITEEKLPI